MHYTCFFIPGNHELWVSSGLDSQEKLGRVLAACDKLGVETGPCRHGGLSILPLHSWHHASFDREPDIIGVPKASSWTIGDYAKCKWPNWINDSFHDDTQGDGSHGSISLALWADSLNPQINNCNLHSSSEDFSISISHFLPDQRLMLEKRFLTYPNLFKAVGSEPLGRRIKSLQPNMHVFGHSHFSWDMRLDGTRFISAPLCYPRERESRMKSISISSPWQDTHDDDHLTPWLPLLIYRASFRSDGPIKVNKANRNQDESCGFPLKDILCHSNVRDWKGEECPYPLGGAMWARYYRMNKRTPENVEMAPWVKARYAKRLRRLDEP